ncbi:hypothetical protein [Burkholderia sp. BCC0044]|uniref:hypothetical protein n=1 Tax=Burkholderia sp. BCC0044 TaxID=2676295 RepID=UPI00158BA7E2|nr:hypothetical protein [Burkholderia sp. BCC0044]
MPMLEGWQYKISCLNIDPLEVEGIATIATSRLVAVVCHATAAGNDFTSVYTPLGHRLIGAFHNRYQ